MNVTAMKWTHLKTELVGDPKHRSMQLTASIQAMRLQQLSTMKWQYETTLHQQILHLEKSKIN